MLTALGISYRFPGAEKPAVDDLSVEIDAGKVVALLGPNGSGKSTFLRAIAGLLPLKHPSASGLVKVRGGDFLSLPPSERAKQMAYVGVDLRHEFPVTVLEAVMMGRIASARGFSLGSRKSDREKAEVAMRLCCCEGLRDRTLATLSAGERQLVALARGVAQGAKVLLLDESLSRMDLHHQAAIGDRLRGLASQGYTIVMVSHDINLAAQWSDECLLIQKGRRVAYGNLRETLTQEAIQQLYPGAKLLVGQNPVSGTPQVFFGNGHGCGSEGSGS